jgi:hypothetical protein
MAKVSILWGECPEHGDEAVTYKFNTEAEANAFRLGIDEMDGFLGYEEVSEGYVHEEEDDWCQACEDGTCPELSPTEDEPPEGKE